MKMFTLALGLSVAMALGMMVSGARAEKAAKDSPKEGEVTGPLDFTLKDIDGKQQPLAPLKGRVVLMVNVASKCGATPQYEGLQKLWEKYKDKGLMVVGVPANNFGGQEPGSEKEIKEFCKSKYNVTFPMMSKISVKGDDIDPLYKWMTDKANTGDFGGEIGWNFTKFLIGRDGQVVGRFNTKTQPTSDEVVAALEKALAEKVVEEKK